MMCNLSEDFGFRKISNFHWEEGRGEPNHISLGSSHQALPPVSSLGSGLETAYASGSLGRRLCRHWPPRGTNGNGGMQYNIISSTYLASTDSKTLKTFYLSKLPSQHPKAVPSY